MLSEGQVAVPLRSALRRHRNVECLLAEVVSTSTSTRARCTPYGPRGEPITVPYDDLVVAAGVRQSYFGHDEFAQHAPGMKTLADALDDPPAGVRRVRDGRRQRPTRTNDGGGSRSRSSAPDPTGVELAGQIRELALHTLRREYHDIDPSEARVLLFDGGDAPLAPFGPELAAKAAKALADLGVELHMHSIVTEVDADGLQVRGPDGATARYEAGTVLWAAGVAAAPLADAVAAPPAPSRTAPAGSRSAPDLTVPGHPEISVVGDMMSLDDLPGRGRGRHADRATTRPGGSRPASAASRPTKPFKLPRPRLGGVHLPRVARWSRSGRCASRAGSAGSRGWSSTSRSSPASATGPARCSPGR